MPTIDRLVEILLTKARNFYLGADFISNMSAVGLFLVALISIETVLMRSRPSRYVSQSARTDVLYTLFELGGIYSLLVSAPVARLVRNGVSTGLPFLRMDLFATMPITLRSVVTIILLDCAGYWLHRATHAVPVLWAFHRVHHSTEALAPLANYRFHFVDSALHTVTAVLVLAALGTPADLWLPIGLGFTWLNLLAHSGHGWSYGLLDRVIVSPRHHRIHHSVDAWHANKNFGMTFSLWDYVFGTVDRSGQAPTGYGLVPPKLPESFFRQIVAPFVLLGEGLRTRRLVEDRR